MRPTSRNHQDQDPSRQPHRTGADEVEEASTARARRRIDGLVVWTALTLGFLGFLARGSVTIHQWRWNAFLQDVQEDVESVRLVDIWTHQAARLPDVEVEALVTGVFYIAIFVFIGGCIAGTWLLLDRAGTGRVVERTPPTAES